MVAPGARGPHREKALWAGLEGQGFRSGSADLRVHHLPLETAREHFPAKLCCQLWTQAPNLPKRACSRGGQGLGISPPANTDSPGKASKSRGLWWKRVSPDNGSGPEMAACPKSGSAPRSPSQTWESVEEPSSVRMMFECSQHSACLCVHGWNMPSATGLPSALVHWATHLSSQQAAWGPRPPQQPGLVAPGRTPSPRALAGVCSSLGMRCWEADICGVFLLLNKLNQLNRPHQGG